VSFDFINCLTKSQRAADLADSSSSVQRIQWTWQSDGLCYHGEGRCKPIIDSIWAKVKIPLEKKGLHNQPCSPAVPRSVRRVNCDVILDAVEDNSLFPSLHCQLFHATEDWWMVADDKICLVLLSLNKNIFSQIVGKQNCFDIHSSTWLNQNADIVPFFSITEWSEVLQNLCNF
jgi:hypothetical protein